MSSPGSRSDSLPLPISLTIYNRLPRSKQSGGVEEDGKSKTKWFRPDYTVHLLLSLRLEIVLKNETGQTEKVIYSSAIHQSSINPVWDHLDERVPFGPDGWGPFARSTFARVLCVDEDEDNPSRSEHGTSILLAESICLDPNSLRRLPKDVHHLNSKPAPLSSLPPNSVLVQYSDGHIRVDPSLYYVLLQNRVIHETNPRDTSLLQDDDEEERRRSRFDDNVFAILGQTDSSIPAPVNVNVSSSLLETDNEELATPVRAVQGGYFYDQDLTTSCSTTVTEDEIYLRDLQSEYESLVVQIEADELSLKAAEKVFKYQIDYLQSTVLAVVALEEETKHIQSAASQVLSDHEKVDFSISFHQRRLVKDLQQIYPISCKNNDRYWIANAELPFDLFRGQVHEDEISAALGFLAQSLVLLSKYLNVALRHRMVCNSSRSAVQDADGTILPLFLSRVAERYQLEQGLLLMHRNVDCMALSQGLVFDETHILAKLDRVYDNIVFGYF